ncbi:MAG: glycosyltransferase [Niabella sp.]|nr:glycosyltransferase [Niabella sp.]
MRKLKVVHIIDDLGRGGAETLLVDILPDLNHRYDLTLVTLNDRNDFPEEVFRQIKKIDLQYKGYADLFAVTRRLKKIIKAERPDLVRSQLFWSTIIARLACGKRNPLVFSVHEIMNRDPIGRHKQLIQDLIERATYRKTQNMIGVTNAVIQNFKSIHPHTGKCFLLSNFVRNEFFKTKYEFSFQANRPLKIVCVGNLRLIKNIPFLIETIKLLPRNLISLDIYGEGPLRPTLEKEIEGADLFNVRLMGRKADIYRVLPDYDLYVSPSNAEGFGIAVAEALSVGLPVIISDIPGHKEIGDKYANYFDLNNTASLIRFIEYFIANPEKFKMQSEQNKVYALKAFRRDNYLNKLDSIYQETAGRI